MKTLKIQNIDAISRRLLESNFTLHSKGIAYIDENSYPDIHSFLKFAKDDLKRRTRQSLWERFKLILSIWLIRLSSHSSDESTQRSYNKEYKGKKVRYGYASAILSQEGIELITGLPSSVLKTFQILDIGAGSNEFLRFCRDELGMDSSQLYGSDISQESQKIIEGDGFTGYAGRIEELGLPQAFDMVYLSYFIDYDTDQEGTFDAVIDLIKPGGLIVLEGQFPVRPFALLKKDSVMHSFVTKGKTVEEDIQLVAESFTQLGKKKNRAVRLERVMRTHRYVRSHYGLNRLDSHFLVFEVERIEIPHKV